MDGRRCGTYRPMSPTRPAGAISRFGPAVFPATLRRQPKIRVDPAHLRYVHGYGNVDRVDPLLVDGTYLRSRFDFTRTRNIAGITSLTFAPSANTHIYGLRYSYVEIHERSIGMDMRLWILATPVDGKKIDMSLASQVRAIRQPEAMDSEPRVSAGRVCAPHHEQVHGVPAGARCPTGCGDLGPQAIPLPAAPLPIRWRGQGLSRLLRSVLSGIERLRCRFLTIAARFFGLSSGRAQDRARIFTGPMPVSADPPGPVPTAQWRGRGELA